MTEIQGFCSFRNGKILPPPLTPTLVMWKYYTFLMESFCLTLNWGAVGIVLASCELDLPTSSPVVLPWNMTESVGRTQYNTAWCVFPLGSLMGEMRPNACEMVQLNYNHEYILKHVPMEYYNTIFLKSFTN